MNQQAERRVGTIIGGKWRVDTLLGSGSMAAVYAVTHRNGARSALKILHPTLCTDPAVCERFLGEGYLANSVKHNGIVRVLDDGVTDDGCVFLVMELLEGETLEEFRQRRGNRLPIPEALELGDKLMDVLSAVHAAGIIHRDLKPQNVFVCHDGTLKLLDFGVARVFDRTSQSKLSMFGLVLGTPSFMSPEQALGSRDKVDHRSDIWSLGATLFTALTGETVHLGANIQAKLLAAATVKARSISMVMPDLPAPIAGAIDMALRFKKEDRWQSVDAMRRALREARSSFGFDAPAKPALYDMSLDEVTHVDKPAFDGAATIPNGPPLPRKAPGGTFIGMQSPFAGTPAQAAPVETAAPQAAPRPPMKSIPPPLPMRPHAGSAPAIDPLALVPHRARIATSPDGLRASRPDGQEGSIPAYGSTLKVDADRTGGDIDLPSIGIRRRGSVGVWLAAVALAAAALGGIAFFAVKRSPVPPKSVGSVAPPPVSIEAPTFTPPPQPTMQLVVPEDSLPATSDSSEGERIEIDAPSPSEEDEAPAPKPARAHHRTHRTHRAAPKPEEVPEIPPDIHFDDPPEPKPTATAPPEKTAEPLPPGLAPDPFGTPE